MYFATFFRLFLGGIFLITGISKIPIFDAFQYSITELIPLTGTILTLTAIGTIAFEIIAGLALLFNKATKLFSGLLAVMLLSFIIALSGALFRYEYYVCTCFGVLGLKLPVNQQIVVDFLLLNMALFVFLFSKSEWKLFALLRERSSQIITPVLLISIIWSVVVITQPKIVFGEKPETTINSQMVFNALPNDSAYRHRLVLMIDISDFLCPQCLEDFLSMGDRLISDVNDAADYSHIFVKRVEFMDDHELQNFLESWREDNEFKLPMHIDTTGIFTQAGFEKSTALLFTALGSLEDMETFPMGSRRRNEIVDRFLR